MRVFLNFALLLTVIAATGRAQSISVVATIAGSPTDVIQGSDGNFYGTAASGGVGMCRDQYTSGGCGAIFKVTPEGTVSTLYSFQPGPDSADSYPFPGALIQGTDGNFYGTTSQGGAGCTYGCGILFKVTPGGSATTLYSFDKTHGSNPLGSLVEATDGNFYGVTANGGTGNCSGGCGTVFKITPQGSLTSLYSFDLIHGATPKGLIQGADGNFYGTTESGGAGDYCPSSDPLYVPSGCGTVFKITPTGALTTIYTFKGLSDDAYPLGTLIQTTDGSFYGIATPPLNALNSGTIFNLTPAGILTTVVVFNGTNGSTPNGLIQASDGNLYGTSSGEGGFVQSGVTIQSAISGTFFQISAAGALQTLYSFCTLGCTEPYSNSGYSPIQANDGNLYGLSSYNGGILFRYNLVSPTAPAIGSSGGVLNGASFQPGIAADSWITINGTNLSSKTDTWTSSIVNGALPTKLDGVSVMVGDQAAYIEYVSSTQINALAPSVAAGTLPVTVTNSNGTSQAVMAQLAAVLPAFFQWGNYVVATRQDFSLAVKNGTFPGTTTVPAAPGDVIILWGTGFGPTSPSAPVGVETPSTTTYDTATAVTVTIGNQPAKVYGAALASGYGGLYQVAIEIPGSLANGDYPVIATIPGAQSSSATLITVQQ